MRFLQRAAAAMGVGGPTLTMAMAEPQQYRGTEVSGLVRLTGGEAELDVRMLTVDLTEFWVTGSGKSRTHHQSNHGRATVAEALKIGPGFDQTFPFRFGLPSNARCTRRREGWTVNAEAHIPWAVDARAYAVLKVLPHPEILAIQRAARDGLGLTPAVWDGSAETVRYQFAAPRALQDRIDGVELRLQVVGDAVVGEMVLNRQEHGVGDLLKAMVGGDRTGMPLQIPRSALLSRRGTPSPAGAYPYLRELLERAGIPVPPQAPGS